MSQRNPTKTEKQWMRIACPVCSAEVGVWCTSPNSERKYLHAERESAFMLAVFALPQ